MRIITLLKILHNRLGVIGKVRGLVPKCDGLLIREYHRVALWDKYFTRAPQPRAQILPHIQRSKASNAALRREPDLNVSVPDPFCDHVRLCSAL